MSEFLSEIWSVAVESLSRGDSPNLLAIGISALVVLPLLSPMLWPTTRNMITVIHELGHAVVAVIFGRRTQGIKLNADTSGVTITRGKPYGLGVIFTAMAGYTAPPALAVTLMWAAMTGYSSITLFALLAILLVMLLFIRNLWGILVVGLSITGLYFAAMSVSRDFHSIIIMSLAFFMLSGGLISIIELHTKHTRGEGEGSDAWSLNDNFKLIPASVWILFFYVVNLIAATLVIDFLFLRK